MKNSVPNRVLVKNRWSIPLLLLVIFACGLQSPAPVFADPTEVSGTISTNTTWSGEILIVGDISVSSGVTLTVLPGTKVMFKHYRGYREPWKRLGMQVQGTIYAVGTAENPIYFTSDAAEPQNGDWRMIRLFNSNSTFSYCVVECGQQAINVWDHSDLDISHSAIRWNNWEGLYFESYSTADIENCQIVQNGYNGLAAEQFNTLTMDYCEIERNGTCGVHIDASTATVMRSLVHDNHAHGLSVDDNATIYAYGDEITGNGCGGGGCGIGYGEGSNYIETSNLTLSNNQSGDICGPYTDVTTSYYPPGSNDIGFTPDMSYALGYTPGDQQLDQYMYIYPDDETRQTIRRIGDGMGLSWSLAWDGQYIWTATLYGTIYKLNPVTGAILQQFSAEGPQPWGMTYDGTNLWVVDFAEKSISKMNPSTGAVLATYPTPDTVGGCKGVTWDGTHLCVMGWTSSVIYKMDQSGNHVATLGLDSGGGGGIAWDGEHFWIPGGGKIHKYDADGHQVGWVYMASEGTWDMTWDGTYLWTAERTNENWWDAKIFMLEILDDHDNQGEAGTLYVDGTNSGDGTGTPSDPYRTITLALSAAVAGDNILVAEGTYTENLGISMEVNLYGGYASYTAADSWTRDIVLHETTIDGGQSGSVVTFSSTALVDGFTITGGSAADAGGGVTVSSGSPTINSCIISGNTAQGSSEWGGGGIIVSGGRSATITNTAIIDNSVSVGGASGVRIGDSATVTMVNCLMAHNSGRPAIHTNGAILTLANVTIADNDNTGIPHAVFLNGGQATVLNCILWDENEGDFQATGGCTYTITYTDVEDGAPTGAGNISSDPRFSSQYGDYHLKSEAGRWDPSAESWVTDSVTSPCIDAGSAASDWSCELWPHGKCINMGTYGGTAEASMSENLTLGNIADLYYDNAVDFVDFAEFADNWDDERNLLPEDLDRDGDVDFDDCIMFCDEWLSGY